MVNLVQQRERERVVRRAQNRVRTRRLHQREHHAAHPPRRSTCVALTTSNRMFSPFESSPVSTLSIAALSDTVTGSSAPDATRPAICAPVKRRHRGRAVAVGDARRQAVVSSSSSTLMFTVGRVVDRNVVLDRHRRAGVDDDAVAVKVGRHEHRGQAQDDGLRRPRARRQRRMVDLVQQREREHVVRRAQNRVRTRRLHQREHRAAHPPRRSTCVGLTTSNRMFSPFESSPRVDTVDRRIERHLHRLVRTGRHQARNLRAREASPPWSCRRRR